MRNLNTKDVVLGIRLMKKLKLKDTLEAVVNEAVEKQKSQRMTGIDLIFSILEALVGTDGEQDLYAWLSGPMECDPHDVEVMDFAVLCENITKIASVEEWRDFFTRLKASTETR